MENRFYSLWFIVACIIFFVLQLIIPGFTELFVLNSKAIYSFEIWRFVSSIFLHGSIIHLGYNLLALFIFGLSLEKIIGGKNFLIVYFSTGILSNLVSVNFYSSSLGSSGAIYGIIGALAIINPMLMVFSFGLILPMFIAATLWTIGDILGALGLFNSNIGHIAHLSGIFFGLLLGIIFYGHKKTNKKPRRIFINESYITNWEKEYIQPKA